MYEKEMPTSNTGWSIKSSANCCSSHSWSWRHFNHTLVCWSEKVKHSSSLMLKLQAEVHRIQTSLSFLILNFNFNLHLKFENIWNFFLQLQVQQELFIHSLAKRAAWSIMRRTKLITTDHKIWFVQKIQPPYILGPPE